MADVLLIDQDRPTIEALERSLRAAGHIVWTAASGAEGLEFLGFRRADAAIVSLRQPDMLALDLLRAIRRLDLAIPVVVTAYGRVTEVLAAIRLGAADFIGQPIAEAQVRQVVESVLSRARRRVSELAVGEVEEEAHPPQPHAAARWAGAVAPIVESPRDPRTMAGWSGCIAASPGAIRNWCFMAGIGPRRSLVFGRLLRAVCLSEGGRRKPENLLDVVDQRTLLGLLRRGGFDRHLIPTEVGDFLARQILVRDAEALRQIEQALIERRHRRPTVLQFSA